jgi:hypothetical protein
MTTPDTAMAAEIDGAPMDLDDEGADTGDADQGPQDGADDLADLSPGDYAAAAGELALEAAEAQDGAPDDDGPADDQSYMKKLRRQAAERRVAAQELGEKLQAADERIDTLQQWQSDRLRRDVEALAGPKLVDPSEVWHVTTLPELLSADGDLDEAKLAAVIADRIPAHWKVKPPNNSPRYGLASGASGRTEARPTSWANAIGPQQQ